MTRDTTRTPLGFVLAIEDGDPDTVVVRVSSDPPACPSCGVTISDERDHATGCPRWGMLPKHWLEDE